MISKKQKKIFKNTLLFSVATVIATILTVIFSTTFLFHYYDDVEKQIHVHLLHKYEPVPTRPLFVCKEILCNGIYYQNKYYDFNIESDTLILNNAFVFPSSLFKHNNINISSELTAIITIRDAYASGEIIHYFTNLNRFVVPIIFLYIVLLIMTNLYVVVILRANQQREKGLIDVELAKDKATLQYDNIMFYIENLNHEISSPLFVLTRKLKEIRNKSVGNEKNFEAIFSSVDQINAVMQRTKEVKKINKASEYRTIYDLIEGTIVTIGVMKSSNFIRHIDGELNKYYLDQDSISNGIFVNILTNHIKNSIDAYSTKLSAEFVSFKKNKLTFTFTDDGNGISPENRKFIFDKGFSTKGDTVSRGSGLHINKAIIESAGGSIKLNNIKDGTQFELVIPVKIK